MYYIIGTLLSARDTLVSKTNTATALIGLSNLVEETHYLNSHTNKYKVTKVMSMRESNVRGDWRGSQWPDHARPYGPW